MRLSRIKLAGFKSFVDPTTLPLPANLTGIVGPNGCGKSNVIDAVRWVMGESSAKHLRGDAMTDVIFNGSSARKPVGQASIELVFDNSDNALGGQYASFNEIAIRRTVTREAQSHYFINGSRCRRRDITDIFLGTGLGPRSYAIIEQGTISRLIEAKPEELRVFLEEAAGISKYKERRRETENRIRHTRENLERLDDLREELDKQLAHLQRQARTAERYKALKEEERLLKVQLLGLRWQALDDETQERETVLREHETALEGNLAEQRRAEAQMEEVRAAQGEANEHLNAVQSDYYAVGAEVARLEQAISHARERRAQQHEERDQVEQAWQEATAHQQHDRDRIAELDARLQALAPEQAAAEERQTLAAETLEEAEAALETAQQAWDEVSAEAAEPLRRAQVERAHIQQHEQQLAQLESRQARLQGELERQAPEPLEAELEALAEAEGEAQQRQAQATSALAEAQARIASHRDQEQGLGERLDQLRTALQSARGRHASLTALQQAALGRDAEDPAGAWLAREGLAEAPRLAQCLEVEPGWEAAVEVVLGPTLEAVWVAAVAPLAERLAALEGDALGLVEAPPTGAVAESSTGGASLAAKVRGAPLADLLLGVETAMDLESALARRQQLPPQGSVVTPSGVWLGRHWVRVAREENARTGVLAREQEIQALEAELAEREGAVAAEEAALAAAREGLATAETERERQQQALDAARQAWNDARSQYQARASRVQQLRERREQLQTELQELAVQHEAHATELAEAQARLHDALAEGEALQERRGEMERARETRREALEQARQGLREADAEAHRQALEGQRLDTERETTRQALARMEQQLLQLGERRERLQQAVAAAEDPVAELTQSLEGHLQQRIEIEGSLVAAREQAQGYEQRLRELAGARQHAEQRVATLRGELEQARMEWQALKTRRETLAEQIQAEGFQREALLASLESQAEAEEWERRLQQVGESIRRLGPINLAAIDEHQQQQERKQYLDDQHRDLMEALETLEEAIRRIDRETRTRFRDTFERVNKGLQEKFPRLFGGGHAYLELTGDDLLNTGVTIMARPPGKRNATIHLLSGGEKALTAVALVFSFFELNPSPFCLLDEVDAPLDDANVGRFCQLVAEMSERVQFIFITHNKVTMELSSQLCGVTMQEPGVSRIVAVDVDEAAALTGQG